MLTNIELCLNSVDLKINNSNLNKEHVPKSGAECPRFYK